MVWNFETWKSWLALHLCSHVFFVHATSEVSSPTCECAAAAARKHTHTRTHTRTCLQLGGQCGQQFARVLGERGTEVAAVGVEPQHLCRHRLCNLRFAMDGWGPGGVESAHIYARAANHEYGKAWAPVSETTGTELSETTGVSKQGLLLLAMLQNHESQPATSTKVSGPSTSAWESVSACLA
jgi:hypothetical protein